MTGSVALLVLAAAAMHASWNAIVKSGKDRLVTQTQVMTVLSLGGLIAAPFFPIPDPASWPFLAASVVTHTGYYGFLLLAYRHGDLGLVYPLARGTAPLLVAGLGLAFAGERLEAGQVVGVLLVSGGILSLATLGRGAGSGRATAYAILTGLFIASYTAIDGLGFRAADRNPGFIAWLLLLSGLPLLAFTLVRRGRSLGARLRRQWVPGLIGGLVAGSGYSLVIWAMGAAPLAHVASLRETSVILAAILGTVFLGESGGLRRGLAALAVAAGNVLLHVAV